MKRAGFVSSVLVLFLAPVLSAASPEAPPDGAWLGGLKLKGEWTLAVAGFKTEQGVLNVSLSLPFEHREGMVGKGHSDAGHLTFEVSDARGTLRGDGRMTDRTLTGEAREGDVSLPFTLYRQLDPAALDAYMGFYRSADGRLLYVQPWVELGGQLMSLDEAGRLHALFPASDLVFKAGTAGLIPEPDAITFTFLRSAEGRITGLRQQDSGGSGQTLERVDLFKREDVKFRNGDVTLAGTLLLPASKGPHPALILTHGSGPQDRTAGLMFVSQLLARGVALLAYDKRGVGESGGSWMQAGFDDLAGDALAGLNLLKGRKDIDATRIGVWGLSQGGWIAPLAASRSRDVAFVVAVSAAAVSPEDQELTRTEYEMRASGAAEEEIKEALSVYRLMNAFVRTGQGWDAYIAARRQAASKPWWPGEAEEPVADDPYFGFWRRIMDYDPVPALRKIACPMLVVYGGVDQNVRPEINQPIMEKALAGGGNQDHKVIVYPTGNHVLLEARSGAPSEMLRLQRFVPGYMETVRDWVLARVGRK